MSTLEDRASEYLAKLHGRDREDAHWRLVELGSGVLPFVTMSFKHEADPSIRTTLVNIAWRTNAAAALPLLTEALGDGEPAVWKEALDGLVTLGNRRALDELREARARAGAGKAEWLDEAIRQVGDTIADAERP